MDRGGCCAIRPLDCCRPSRPSPPARRGRPAARAGRLRPRRPRRAHAPIPTRRRPDHTVRSRPRSPLPLLRGNKLTHRTAATSSSRPRAAPSSSTRAAPTSSIRPTLHRRKKPSGSKSKSPTSSAKAASATAATAHQWRTAVVDDLHKMEAEPADPRSRPGPGRLQRIRGDSQQGSGPLRNGPRPKGSPRRLPPGAQRPDPRPHRPPPLHRGPVADRSTRSVPLVTP